MAIGTLENGALFSIQIEGAQRHRTGLQIDITGTDGILRITNPRAFENKDDNTIEGVNGDGTSLSPLPVPASTDRSQTPVWMLASRMCPYLYKALRAIERTGHRKPATSRTLYWSIE
jgi:hypothetical protein